MTGCAASKGRHCGPEIPRGYRHRLWEAEEAESGIRAERYPEKGGNRRKGVPESSMICGL